MFITFLQYILSSTLLVLFHLQELQLILDVSTCFVDVEQAGVWGAVCLCGLVCPRLVRGRLAEATGIPNNSSLLTYRISTHKHVHAYFIMFIYSKQIFQGLVLNGAES